MSSKTTSDDLLKAEMAALVQEKLRTGAYLDEIEKAYETSEKLVNLHWKWVRQNFKPDALKLENIDKRRNAWIDEMAQIVNGITQDQFNQITLEAGKCDFPKKEFNILSEEYIASHSNLLSIKHQLNVIKRKFEEEKFVFGMAARVHRIKAQIEYLEKELKKVEKE